MEYIEDLKSYYETGYGNELNKKIGCLPLKDMMDKFTRMIEHPGIILNYSTISGILRVARLDYRFHFPDMQFLYHNFPEV